MSKGNSVPVSVRVIPNTTGNPPGKLADPEVIFEADAGPLDGLKLIGNLGNAALEEGAT